MFGTHNSSLAGVAAGVVAAICSSKGLREGVLKFARFIRFKDFFSQDAAARFFVLSGAVITATKTPLRARATPKTPTPRFAWRAAAAIAPGLGLLVSSSLWRSGAVSAAPAFIMAFNCAVRAQGSCLSFVGGPYLRVAERQFGG